MNSGETFFVTSYSKCITRGFKVAMYGRSHNKIFAMFNQCILKKAASCTFKKSKSTGAFVPVNGLIMHLCLVLLYYKPCIDYHHKTM